METIEEKISPAKTRKRILTVSAGSKDGTDRYYFPFVRLHGKYLLQAGFNVKDKIEVSIGRGKIFIKKVLQTIP